MIWVVAHHKQDGVYYKYMKKIIGMVLLVASMGLPVFVFALNPMTGGGTIPPDQNVGIANPIKYDTFSDFVSAVTETAVKILLPFIVLAFIYSGFLFVKAQGNEKGLEEAKSAIWWSIVGAFILMGAWGFAQIIGETVYTITNP